MRLWLICIVKAGFPGDGASVLLALAYQYKTAGCDSEVKRILDSVLEFAPDNPVLKRKVQAFFAAEGHPDTAAKAPSPHSGVLRSRPSSGSIERRLLHGLRLQQQAPEFARPDTSAPKPATSCATGHFRIEAGCPPAAEQQSPPAAAARSRRYSEPPASLFLTCRQHLHRCCRNRRVSCAAEEPVAGPLAAHARACAQAG